MSAVGNHFAVYSRTIPLAGRVRNRAAGFIRIKWLVAVICLACPGGLLGQGYTIKTFAGGGLPVNIAGTSASLGFTNGVAVDPNGNIFIISGYTVLRQDAVTGVLTLVAGNGTPTTNPVDGPAASAQLYYPQSVAADSLGNVYIADPSTQRVRKVSNGIITTVAGGGSANPVDNGPATDAYIEPTGIAVDSKGNLYIADHSRGLILKVANGVITTIAGNGTWGYSGDNGPATSAQLYPQGVAVDSLGNVFVADAGANRVREISNGVITTIAGSGMFGFSGDNGPAVSARLSIPCGVAVDSAGNVYIADEVNQRVRKVSGGVITTVAGSGYAGFSGDSGVATSAWLFNPVGVAIDSSGNLYIADLQNSRVRKVSGGMITTVAGGGAAIGDNGPATSTTVL